MTVATSLTYQNLPELLAGYRKTNKKIVLTQGTFDMLHIGHARYLEEAKSHGDVLIVGVDSDEKVRARKGPDRPIVPEDERLEMLSHLRSVDHVVLKPADAERWALIKLALPDVLIATTKTYTDPELEELKQHCKKIVVLEPMATTSTSAKLRLVQVGAAKKIEKTLSTKLVKAIEEVLLELKTV
ncbi:MAG: adenylyltransferase/cytidyltransferase family protein [bacterium]|nr:adenylyltransferase/cytidyltransferase family protein [bacterium]